MGSNAQAAATPYQFAGQKTADQGALAGVSQLGQTNYAGQNQGQVQNIAGNIAGGNSYDAAGSTQAGNNLTGQVNSLIPYATQTLQTGFDPQNALYNQQFQQNTDQTRATEAAQGTAGTPYGAGVENTSDQNFNLNWQNQELARQQQAAGTASTLLGSAGNAASTGTALGQSVGTNALGALQTADQTGAMANQNTQQQIADFLSYLSGGTSANNAATQATSVTNQGIAQNNNWLNTLLTDAGSGVGTLLGY